MSPERKGNKQGGSEDKSTYVKEKGKHYSDQPAHKQRGTANKEKNTVPWKRQGK